MEIVHVLDPAEEKRPVNRAINRPRVYIYIYEPSDVEGLSYRWISCRKAKSPANEIQERSISLSLSLSR